MLKDFFKIGFNNLKRRKLRSWLTMIGIFIGIAAVVSLISLGQGLQTAVTGQFGALATDKLTIQNAGTGLGPPGSTVIKKLNSRDIKIIEGVPGVELAITRLIRTVQVRYNNKVEYLYLIGNPSDSEKLEIIYKSIGLDIAKGRTLNKNDFGKVLIGSDLAEKTLFGKRISLGKDLVIEGKRFEVIGIMEKASTFIFNSAIFMLEEDAEDILDIEDETDIIIAQVKNPDDIEKVAENIEKALRKDRGLKEGEEDFTVQTPIQSLKTVNAILDTINIIVAGIALISLLVGGIGIANTMYTSVLERKKEIGTMKAIGAKNSDILLLFIIESGLLGLVGGIIGVALGAVMALGISAIANNIFGSDIFIVNLSIPLMVSAISFSFFIGILSGIFPSYQASKLKPVEALRG